MGPRRPREGNDHEPSRHLTFLIESQPLHLAHTSIPGVRCSHSPRAVQVKRSALSSDTNRQPARHCCIVPLRALAERLRARFAFVPGFAWKGGMPDWQNHFDPSIYVQHGRVWNVVRSAAQMLPAKGWQTSRVRDGSRYSSSSTRNKCATSLALLD